MRAHAELAIPPFVEKHIHIERYSEIQEIMESPDFSQGRSPERDLFFGGSLVMLDGSDHQEKKRRYSALFTKKAVVHYERDLMEPVIRQVLSETEAASDGDGSLIRADLVPLVRIMLHRISATVTGIDGVHTPAATEEFRLLIEKLAEAAAGQWSVKDREALTEEGVAARKALIDKFLRPSLERRLALVADVHAGRLSQEELPLDVLTLICLNDPDSLQDRGPDAYVWRECTLFMTAATQTTTHQLPNVVWHLEKWWGQHPEDAARKSDPAFLRLAVNESLRLHQTAPVKTRIATRDVTLTSGRSLKEGDVVALFAPKANQDPALFGADAAEFNPYRERPTNVSPWGLTFGAGSHSCLGKNLVTGLFNRGDPKTGAEGTMVKILTILYESGLELDPDAPAERIATSFHDAFATMPILLCRH